MEAEFAPRTDAPAAVNAAAALVAAALVAAGLVTTSLVAIALVAALSALSAVLAPFARDPMRVGGVDANFEFDVQTGGRVG